MTKMRIIKSPAEIGECVTELRRQGKRIGFVPTLGNLHQGHTKLIKALDQQCDVKVVSIFVNPVQFGANEDLANYPRSEQEDLRVCEEDGTDIVFLPQAEDIYVGGAHPLTQVNIPSMSSLHCGISRPTHFMGVLTIVSLLFNLVKPHCAAFGRKDFQQLRMIQIMTKELHFPVDIIAVDTGRAADGLALSSRNRYLTAEERSLAPAFYQCLLKVMAKVRENGRKGEGGQNAETYYRALESQTIKELEQAGFTSDYVHIARQLDLQQAQVGDKDLVLLGAVYLGKARLIDNLII